MKLLKRLTQCNTTGLEEILVLKHQFLFGMKKTLNGGIVNVSQVAYEKQKSTRDA
jgi:hypothetical protein